jgi:hypothetical protein
MAPTLKSYFKPTKTLKENIFIFGLLIYLKSRVDRQAPKRYVGLPIPEKFPKYIL